MMQTTNPKYWHQCCKKTSKEDIPTLIKDSQTISDDAGKAETFNVKFTTKARNMSHTLYPILPARTNRILEDIDFSTAAVREILKELDVSKSSGPDGIQNQLNQVLKECASSLSEPLSFMFSLSYRTGKLPKEWKKARVVPVYKNKGSRCDPAQYRPISLTSSVGKIMEKLVNKVFLQHLIENSLISAHQFGFLPKHSTTDELVLLLHELHSAMNEKQKVIASFLDLASAFDMVPHSGILHKLPAYGIRGYAFRWITDFLKDRQQYV